MHNLKQSAPQITSLWFIPTFSKLFWVSDDDSEEFIETYRKVYQTVIA